MGINSKRENFKGGIERPNTLKLNICIAKTLTLRALESGFLNIFRDRYLRSEAYKLVMKPTMPWPLITSIANNETKPIIAKRPFIFSAYTVQPA
jgi:hypothetical protein